MSDQTQFTETQEILQKPPVEPPTPEELVKIEKAKKSRRKVVLLISAVIFVVILAAIAASFLRPPTPPQLTPSPSPSPISQPETLLEKELNDLKDQIDAADPQEIELQPPPVDMNVVLQAS